LKIKNFCRGIGVNQPNTAEVGLTTVVYNLFVLDGGVRPCQHEQNLALVEVYSCRQNG
jgi:hypothetical protein